MLIWLRLQVAYLRNGLDIPSGRLVGVLIAVPRLLWLDVEYTLKPKVLAVSLFDRIQLMSSEWKSIRRL